MRAVTTCALLGVLGCAQAGSETARSGGDDAPEPDAAQQACTTSCDDNDACTVDSCDNGTCRNVRMAPTGMQAFNFNGMMQTFVVPACVTSLHILAAGAQGGGAQVHPGGMGATMIGDFTVAPNDSISILVGGQGAAYNPNPPTSIYAQRGGTGGGGTFVVNGTTILVIAGGGGGASGNNGIGDGPGGPGQITTNGQAGGPPDNYAGGSNGGGGTTTNNPNGFQGGTGGGGYSGDGSGPSNGHTMYGTPNQPGRAYTNGGAGGAGGSLGRAGGFGGAGAAGYTGGGGGGYSGGGAGPTSPTAHAGGGGGSINNGTNPMNTPGNNPGHGKVEISW